MRARSVLSVCSLCSLCSLALGCGSPPDLSSGDGEDATAALAAGRTPAYRDVEEALATPEEQERWFALRRGLRADFDEICGDTFCEGDFTNLEALSFRCSVSTRSGQLGSCLFLFAGSYETVTASTGNIRPVARFFRCAIPVAGHTPAALLDALLAPEGRGPLWRPLPGVNLSIYDALGGCL
jgi:hypothetical protein